MTHPPMEPYRIKTVEPLPLPTREERETHLKKAHYNPFQLRAGQITIDLLTDSGTGAMSAQQWAAMMTGDETYAGSESYYQLEAVVQDLTGMTHVIPAHQGRSSEHVLFSALPVQGKTVLANSHFDTTRSNIKTLGGTPIDLVTEDAFDLDRELPFKGNMDLDKLAEHLARLGDEVAMVLMTVTNNSVGGQPVSLANLRATAELAHRYGKPFFLDAARFAENAWFIKAREPGQADRPVKAIVREMFDLADGFTMSAKKDGLVNMGGLLCMNDDRLAERAKAMTVLIEGYPTYGGLAGRDIAAMAVGLEEVLDEAYLTHRIGSIRAFFARLDAMGVPMLRPPGGHAVFVDARRFFPKIPPHQYPGLALINELYREGGIRAVESGTFMSGRFDPALGHDRPAPMDLVRLTFPRRTYTQSHMDYVADVIGQVFSVREQVSGYRIIRHAAPYRGFTAQLEPLG